MCSYGKYNGKGWDDATKYTDLINDDLAASYLTSIVLENQSARIEELQIKSHCGIYALPYYTAIYRGSCAIQSDDTLSAGDASDIYTAWYLSNKTDKFICHDELWEYELNYRDFVYSQYLDIDEESLNYMLKLINENGFYKDDPQIIDNVAHFIQNAAKYNLEYDTNLDNERNIAVAFLDTYKEGVCRHYASAATLLFRALGIPARYTVGAVAETEAGQWTNVTADKAHAWVEVYIDGVGWVFVEVTGSLPSGNLSGGDGGNGGGGGNGGNGGGNLPELDYKVTLKPVTVRKQLDGTPLYAENVLSGFEKYEKLGYWYNVVVSGERTEAGMSKSTIESINIYDASGNPADDMFEITLEPGVIHVYKDIIYCSSPSMDMEYNGKSPELYVDCKTPLEEGFKIEFTSTASSNVGTHLNTFKAELYDSQNNKVTDEYWIQKEYGKVTILIRSLTIKAGDAQMVYDGSPLTCEEYVIESGELAEGHQIVMVTMSGSQTELGRSENLISYVLILDEEQKDVTSNYSLILKPGILRVTSK